jgi:hypothetical protein
MGLELAWPGRHPLETGAREERGEPTPESLNQK